MFHTEKDTLRRAAGYQEGKEVTVYYDSGGPSWAVLEKGVVFLPWSCQLPASCSLLSERVRSKVP